MFSKLSILWLTFGSFLFQVTESAGIWRQENMLGSPHLVYYPEEEAANQGYTEDEDDERPMSQEPAYHQVQFAVQDQDHGYQRLSRSIWNPKVFRTIPEVDFFFHNNQQASQKVEGRGFRQPRSAMAAQKAGEILWTYNQEGGLTQDHWKEQYRRCGGNRQSPIVIMTNMLKPMYVDDVKFGDGYFSHNGHHVDFYNNGHGLSINLVNENHRVTLSEGPLSYTYSLVSIQFIYRSLHLVDGKQYPMEILFIHKISGVSFEEAKEMENGIVIMSVLVVGAPSTAQLSKEKRQTSQALLSFTSHSSILGRPGARLGPLKVLVSLISLVPLVPHQFFLYKGSFPYPPCTEGVIWMVDRAILTVPLDVLQTVMANLKEMRNALTLPITRNNRKSQPLNGRQVHLLMIGDRPATMYNKDGKIVNL